MVAIHVKKLLLRGPDGRRTILREFMSEFRREWLDSEFSEREGGEACTFRREQVENEWASEACCKDCLAFRLGSERNDRTGAPVGHASTPQFLLSFRLASRLHFHPPSRLDHRRKTNCERITSHPTLTASRYPFLTLLVFPFFLYFRQRPSILSRSSTALVRPRTFSNTFLLTFADIFLSFLLHFS